jgi:hypothetical protein
MKRYLTAISLIVTVFLAGCIGQTPVPTKIITAGANGVIIKSFSPDLTTTDGGTDVTFSLYVKNVGDKKATNVKAALFGLSDEWGNLSYDSTAYIMGNLVNIIPSEMSGADPSLGFEGEEGGIDFTATSPSGKAVDTTYDATARVFYTYSTISENLLRVATTDYLRSITPPGQPLPKDYSVLKSKSSSGPLLVNVKTRLATIPKGARSVRVQFEIQNTGGGRVFTNYDGMTRATIDSNDLDKISKIDVTSNVDCGNGYGGSLTDVKLVGGKSKVIICTVDVSDMPAAGYIDKAINFNLTYNYFVESTTQVTVLKALE